MDAIMKDIVKHLTARRQSDTTWDWPQTWELSNRTVKQLRVPCMVTDGSRAVEASDFAVYTHTAEALMKLFLQLLQSISEKLRDDPDVVADPALTASLVLLYAEHSGAQLWTTEATISGADEALRLWMSALGEDSVAGLLRRGDAYKPAVAQLLTALDRADWKADLAAVVAFQIVLVNLDYLRFRDGEQRIMIAVSLRLVDDFELANLLAGIACLRHLVNNVTSSDLRQYYLVVLAALTNLLPRREPSIIRAVVPCGLDLLRKMERKRDDAGRGSYDIPFAWSESDSFLASLLTAMQWEDGGAMTIEYLTALPQFLTYRPIAAHRFSKRILELSERYLGFGDSALHSRHGAVNLLALQVILQFIAATGEVVHLYSDKLCVMLMKKQLYLSHGCDAPTAESRLLREELDRVLAMVKQCDQHTHDKYRAVVASCA